MIVDLPRLDLRRDQLADVDPPFAMNESDTDANTKAIDSLLNYETVKYFGAERREAERYDRSMARYESSSIKTYVSLTVLNAGQTLIFTIGMTAVMMMSISGIRSGTPFDRRLRAGQRDDDPAFPAA